MKTLKKLFPYSFGKKGSLGALLINVLVYLIIGAIASVLIFVLSAFPIVNLVTGILGGLVDLYVIIGIILSILHYAKAI